MNNKTVPNCKGNMLKAAPNSEAKGEIINRPIPAICANLVPCEFD